jgi:site-specific recombinase XerD
MPGKRRPITENGLRKATDEAFKKAGVTDFRRHDFRHTFASRALRSKTDLRSLMAAMDHQDISSTVRYTHMASGQARGVREGVKVNRDYPENVTPLKGRKGESQG